MPEDRESVTVIYFLNVFIKLNELNRDYRDISRSIYIQREESAPFYIRKKQQHHLLPLGVLWCTSSSELLWKYGNK